MMMREDKLKLLMYIYLDQINGQNSWIRETLEKYTSQMTRLGKN